MICTSSTVKGLICLGLLVIFQNTVSISQNSMGVGTNSPNQNAVLELVSPGNNQGFLMPRLTTGQRTDPTFLTNLSGTSMGLMVYDLDDNNFYFWNGSVWIQMAGAPSTVNTDATIMGDGDGIPLSVNTGTGPNEIVQLDGSSQLPAVDGSQLSNVTSGNFTGALAGDVTGTQGATTIATGAVSGGTGGKIADNTITDDDISTLSTGVITGLGTAASLNAGAAANNVVQLDGSSRLPAVDASLLTNVPTNGSLQTAYNNGNTISTGGGNPFSVTGSEAISFNAGSGNNLSLFSTGNLLFTGANFSVGGTGIVSATSFSGDGSSLTGLTPGNLFTIPFADDATTAAFGSNTIISDPTIGAGLEIIDDTGGGGAVLAAASFSANPTNNSPALILFNSRGTQASQAALQNGDYIGEIEFGGAVDGAAFGTAATIEAVATENFNPGASGSDLIFSTTPNTTVIPVERMRISEAGFVGIGNSTPLSDLHIGNEAHIITEGDDLVLTDNIHTVGGVPTYTNNGAGMVLALSGTGTDFNIFEVPSGSAGNPAPLTTLMTIQSGTSFVSTNWQAQDVTVAGDLTNASELIFGDADNSALLRFKAPDVVSNPVLWTLPDGDGAEEQVLSTDGLGTLQWTTAGHIAGTSSSAVGSNAGVNNTGNFNAFFGNNAGQSNTTAANNTFIGYNAGNANTTNNANTYVGSNSGANSTNINNTFAGYNSGLNNTGANNTIFGYASGSSGTGLSGNGNVFVGSNAGQQNTTAGFNTIVGANAGRDNTTGTSNTYIGQNAGIVNVGGGNNTLIGASAGSLMASGDNNVFIGQGTASSITSSTGNILIGQNATLGSNGLSNAVAIGNSVSADANNAIVIGGAAHNVGIGVSTPSSKLDVNGTVTATAVSVTGGNVTIPMANDYAYSTPKTQYYSLSNKQFNITGGAAGLEMGELGSNYRYVENGAPGSPINLYAPVNFPDGATIIQVVSYVYDNDTDDVSVGLIRFDPVAQSSASMTTVSTTGTPGDATLTSGFINGPVITNSSNSYYIQFSTRQATSELRIIGVKIEYTVDKAN